MYMSGSKYVNLVEIGKVVFEIQMAEFGNFTVPVNSTLVCLVYSFGFLAADTLLCVLIESCSYIITMSLYFKHNDLWATLQTKVFVSYRYIMKIY